MKTLREMKEDGDIWVVLAIAFIAAGGLLAANLQAVLDVIAPGVHLLP